MCEYCEPDEWNSLIGLKQSYDWAEVALVSRNVGNDESEWMLALESHSAYQGMHGYLEINYCPMCGRRLNDV